MDSGRQRHDRKSTLCQLFCLLRNSNFKFKKKIIKNSTSLPRRQQRLLLSSLKECFNKNNMKTATVLIYVVYLLFITYTSNIDKIKKLILKTVIENN